MTQEQIQQLFQQRYNRNNWKQFLSSTFSNIRLYSTVDILTGIDDNIADKAIRLGYLVLNEDGIERNIGIYEVTFAEGIILERNRVGLRNLLRKYWKNIDAAFITYHRPDNKNWRFTYVSELTGFDAQGEQFKLKTEPKRYTYILGEGETCRTAAEQFYTITRKGNLACLDDVKEAFSVEKLSKAFFEDYKAYYQLFCDYLIGSKYLNTIFNGDEKAIRDFTKNLLGRIVFLYFIQKKGWLAVPVHSKWGEGNHTFLTDLFSQCRDKKHFYRDYLSKLFFNTLNTPRKGDIIELISGQPCRIPYLNGGLFEDDKPQTCEIEFLPKLFDDLFGFFNQYNFTIYEDSPDDHTIAVDPEMLGHIFENLLEDNKDKGAYYTPKEIVHFMCQESLIEYLTTWFENKGYEITGYVGFDKLNEQQLFSVNDGRKGQMILETNNKEKINKIDRKLIERLLKKKLDDNDKALVKEHLDELINALDSVKICDPAIGSGAFPMGLLQEIFTTKETLYTFVHGNTKGFNSSSVKLKIIQNSIYGVDIEKGAVDIARLRFWLSLIIDEVEPKPLPNLDFNIVVGDSLVSKFNNEIIQIEWEVNAISDEIKALKGSIKKNLDKLLIKQKVYFTYAGNKQEIQSEIRNLKIDLLISQLALSKYKFKSHSVQQGTIFSKTIQEQNDSYQIEAKLKAFDNSIHQLKVLKSVPEKPLFFFDWKLDFPEIMNKQVAEKIGFDIVITNPPYLKERDNAHIFDVVNRSKIGQLYHQGKMDFWYYFLHTAVDIVKEKGCISFITSRYWINSQGAKKLINRVKENLSFVTVVDIGKLKVFDNVAGQHMIAVYSKTKKNEFKYKNISNDIRAIESEINSENINIRYLSNIKVFYGNEIIFAKQDVNSDFKKALGEYYDLSQGVVEASDKVSRKQYKRIGRNNVKIGDGIFVLDDDEVNKLNLNDQEKQLLVKYLDPSDVKKWAIQPTKKKYLIYSDNIGKEKINRNAKFKSLRNHLNFYSDFISSSNKPYGLHRPRVNKYFINKKILFAGMFEKNDFTIDVNSYYVGMSFVLVIEKSKDYSLEFLLGLLNSKYALYWFYTYGKKRGVGVDIGVEKLRQFPLPNLKSHKIDDIVNLLLKRDSQKIEILEEQLDNLVYKLYELSYEEVKKVDPYSALSKLEYEAIII